MGSRDGEVRSIPYCVDFVILVADCHNVSLTQEPAVSGCRRSASISSKADAHVTLADYYSRYRPGIGSVLVFLTLLSVLVQYAVQHLSRFSEVQRIRT